MQTVPAPRHEPLHCACVVIVQPTAPLAVGRQHAPVTGAGGHSVLVQIVLLPWYTPPVAAAHCVAVEMKHTGPAKPWAQHAPVAGGGAHVSFPHTVPLPRKVPVHWAAVVIEHPTVPEVGLAAQHAPVGIGQSVAVHTEPAPCHTELAKFAQFACVSIWHGTIVSRPGSMQHAPVGGAQVSFPHTVPAPRQVPWIARQSACVLMVQTAPTVPAAAAQHAPVAGAGLHSALGVVFPHVDPAPCHTPPAVARHCASVPTTHGMNGAVEAVRQHAPVGVVIVHEVLVHAEPTPSHRPCNVAHPASVVIEHAAPPFGLGAQHAPVFVCPNAVPIPTPRTAAAQHSASAPLRTRARTSMRCLLDSPCSARNPAATPGAHHETMDARRARHRQGAFRLPDNPSPIRTI